jgi:hypothetical protein
MRSSVRSGRKLLSGRDVRLLLGMSFGRRFPQVLDPGQTLMAKQPGFATRKRPFFAKKRMVSITIGTGRERGQSTDLDPAGLSRVLSRLVAFSP